MRLENYKDEAAKDAGYANFSEAKILGHQSWIEGIIENAKAKLRVDLLRALNADLELNPPSTNVEKYVLDWFISIIEKRDKLLREKLEAADKVIEALLETPVLSNTAKSIT